MASCSTCVALYLYSTSNHNVNAWREKNAEVALYLYSTSNHNNIYLRGLGTFVALYLYSTSNHNRFKMPLQNELVALYLYSTSNHNSAFIRLSASMLLYTFILHQTTTQTQSGRGRIGCFIPLFYIKPQLIINTVNYPQVALYLYSTSNHNQLFVVLLTWRLLYTFILHQTTTMRYGSTTSRVLLYTFILHQTTTNLRH